MKWLQQAALGPRATLAKPMALCGARVGFGANAMEKEELTAKDVTALARCAMCEPSG